MARVARRVARMRKWCDEEPKLGGQRTRDSRSGACHVEEEVIFCFVLLMFY